MKNYQTLPNAILQERVKITCGWHILERRLDLHVEICFLLVSIFFSSHYIIKTSIYHPSRLPAEGPVHCFSSYKQWPLNSKLAMHHNAHGYQKPLNCQEKLWRLLLLPNSYLCNAVIQSGWSPCVDCGYIGFSAFLTAMLFCYNCFIPGLSAYFWEVVLKQYSHWHLRLANHVCEEIPSPNRAEAGRQERPTAFCYCTVGSSNFYCTNKQPEYQPKGLTKASP